MRARTNILVELNLVAPGAIILNASSRAHKVVERTVLRWPLAEHYCFREWNDQHFQLCWRTWADIIIILYRMYKYARFENSSILLNFYNHFVRQPGQGLLLFLMHRALKGLLFLESKLITSSVYTYLVKLTMIYLVCWFIVHICIFH